MSTLLYYRLFSQRLILLFSIIEFLLPNQINEEFRGTWVITWDHIDKNKNAVQNINHLQQIIDNHKSANMNAIIFAPQARLFFTGRFSRPVKRNPYSVSPCLKRSGW